MDAALILSLTGTQPVGSRDRWLWTPCDGTSVNAVYAAALKGELSPIASFG